jgi:hypothetical protein
MTLAGLGAGVVWSHSLSGMAVLLAGMAGAALSLPRRARTRVVGLVACAFAFGAVDAAVRAPERQPLALLARTVPWCEAAGRTLEDAGGLGVLAAIDDIDCDGHGRVLDAGAAFVDDFEIPPGTPEFPPYTIDRSDGEAVIRLEQTAGPPQTLASRGLITSVTMQSGPPAPTEIRVRFSGSVGAIEDSRVRGPARIAIDFFPS